MSALVFIPLEKKDDSKPFNIKLKLEASCIGEFDLYFIDNKTNIINLKKNLLK
jgi:hypothetical protein